MDKLNIDDIKYCVEEFKPEGFKNCNTIDDRYILTSPSKEDYIIEDIKDYQVLAFNNEVYPLFITRVIEGINKKEDLEFYIEVDYNNTVTVVNSNDGADFAIFRDDTCIDKAKESAIYYIIDQLRK